jgi:SAM-dependent methyltransferase
MAFNAPDVDPTEWEKYYRARAGAPPRATLLKALSLFEAEGLNPTGKLAYDLGSGSGMDTLELLRRGWRVWAIDKEPSAIEWLEVSVPPRWKPRYIGQLAAFESLSPLLTAWLVNASYSFPFCHPSRFDVFWSRVVQAVPAGGRIAGQFFGPNDTWADDPTMTFHTRAQLEALLQGFAFDLFDESESDGKTALGEAKHWHEFAIIAKRVSAS